MTRITRLGDRKILELSDLTETQLMDAPGVFDVKQDLQLSAGALGEAILLSSSLAQKTFSMNFLSNDMTGRSQMALHRFFSTAGWYRVEDEEMQLDGIEFSVASIDAPFHSSAGVISLTCQARYGDLIDETRVVLHEQTLTGTEYFPGWTGSFLNESSTEAEIILSLSASRRVTWAPGTQINLEKIGSGSLTARVGRTSGTGQLSPWSGLTWVLNSDREVTEGYGIVLPLSASFFKVAPLESAQIRLGSFSDLLASDSVEIELRLEAVSVKQREDTL